jgi:hypothetical protein
LVFYPEAQKTQNPHRLTGQHPPEKADGFTALAAPVKTGVNLVDM